MMAKKSYYMWKLSVVLVKVVKIATLFAPDATLFDPQCATLFPLGTKWSNSFSSSSTFGAIYLLDRFELNHTSFLDVTRLLSHDHIFPRRSIFKPLNLRDALKHSLVAVLEPGPLNVPIHLLFLFLPFLLLSVSSSPAPSSSSS